MWHVGIRGGRGAEVVLVRPEWRKTFEGIVHVYDEIIESVFQEIEWYRE